MSTPMKVDLVDTAIPVAILAFLLGFFFAALIGSAKRVAFERIDSAVEARVAAEFAAKGAAK